MYMYLMLPASSAMQHLHNVSDVFDADVQSHAICHLHQMHGLRYQLARTSSDELEFLISVEFLFSNILVLPIPL